MKKVKQSITANYVENTSRGWIYTLKRAIKPGGRVAISELREQCLNWRFSVENREGLVIKEGQDE